ncbi:hypothetical protein MMC10_001082 [Thelotrema lepadinum]|nr:hypothetical protein [Thelotrema lepadinum]
MDRTTPTPNNDTPLPPYEPWPSTRNLSADGGKAEQQLATAMDIDSTTERSSRAPSAFSVDDLEVARALTSLQEGVNTPDSHNYWNATNISQASQSATPIQRLNSQPLGDSEPQPLLKLFISQHPLIASTITGSLSAYSNSKSYSPSFKVGAEFLERNLAGPMANTVNTASRISGVETGMRWWLQRNDSGPSNTPPNGSDQRPQTQSNKRRRSSEGLDSMPGPPPVHRARGFSELSQPESLPPYDDRRSPAYEENYIDPHKQPQQHQHQQQQSPNAINQSWSTRVAIHTSGLGVAMSDESLRSLKYCLTWLRWANAHLSTVLTSLQATLEEWERSQRYQAQQQQEHEHDPSSMEGVISTADTGTGAGAGPRSDASEPEKPTRDQATIAASLQSLKNECVKTLKTALDVVSKYAGGALPENARWLVRCHLTSLPARFRLHTAQASASRKGSSVTMVDGVGGMGDEEAQLSETEKTQPEAVTGAQRVIVLAKEGLDMMAQVSAVVDGTIVSAEDWCERLGRRKNGPGEGGQTGETGARAREGQGQGQVGEKTPLLVGMKREGERGFAVPAVAPLTAPPMVGVQGAAEEGQGRERERERERPLGKEEVEALAREAVESVERQ